MSKKAFDHTVPSDSALLVLYANGDINAAKELMVRLGGKVFTQAYHKLQNHADAEDVMQEAFMKLWRIAPNWQQDKAQISTWMYRVTENLCIDHLRKKRGASLDDLTHDPADPMPSVGAKLQDKHRVDLLYKAIEDLPQRQAQAIRLRHLSELSNPEIAQIMDISVEAVESLLSRGKRTLSSLLKHHKTALGYLDDKV